MVIHSYVYQLHRKQIFSVPVNIYIPLLGNESEPIHRVSFHSGSQTTDDVTVDIRRQQHRSHSSSHITTVSYTITYVNSLLVPPLKPETQVKCHIKSC